MLSVMIGQKTAFVIMVAFAFQKSQYAFYGEAHSNSPGKPNAGRGVNHPWVHFSNRKFSPVYFGIFKLDVHLVPPSGKLRLGEGDQIVGWELRYNRLGIYLLSAARAKRASAGSEDALVFVMIAAR